MRPMRSMLFVPGNRPTWIAKALAAQPDALVLDLEDSVPVADKEGARRLVAEAVAAHKDASPLIYVRTNRGTHIYDYEDVMAVVRPGLAGIFVAKAEGPEDVDLLSRIIAAAEERRAMAIGGVKLVVALETARAVELAFGIASHPRVYSLCSAAAKGADVARNLGFNWTPQGLETLYHRSRAIVACRAAGKANPIGGLWQDVHDLEGLRKFSQFNRDLGFRGEIVLHPSNVAVVNEVYSLSDAERSHFEGLIAAFEAAEAQGRASVMYEGEHIDIAHVATAREILRTHARTPR
jgi:citrate lyase subunit beta / citryl-CoA lyase